MNARITESHRHRRIVGRLEPGSDVSEAISDLCQEFRVTAGEIRLSGVVGDPALSELDPDHGIYRPSVSLPGRATIVTSHGTIASLGDTTVIGLTLVLSWSDRGQARVAGGQLRTGRAVNVEIVIDAFDDVVLERRLDPKIGMPVLANVRSREGSAPQPRPEKAPAAPAKPAPPAAPAPKPEAAKPAPSGAIRGIQAEPLPAPGTLPRSRPTGWDDLVAISETLDAEKVEWQEGSDVDVSRGDILLHPRFGRCKIIRIENGDRVVLKDDKGKSRTLALSYVELKEESEPGDRPSSFRVRVAGR